MDYLNQIAWHSMALPLMGDCDGNRVYKLVSGLLEPVVVSASQQVVVTGQTSRLEVVH